MTRSKLSIFLVGAAVALTALAVAGCGGGSATPEARAQPKTSSGDPATVAAQDQGDLGTTLVDSQGRTLYLFAKDSGDESACFGACASAWPPLRDGGKPTAGDGLDPALLGTTSRSDGGPQITYNGHPLYLFSGDEERGDAEGQGSTAFGAAWWALDTGGNAVTAQASSDTSESGAGSSGGYGY
jgi:predicted lipoprotein with Yx(FWY)xxD motif